MPANNEKISVEFSRGCFTKEIQKERISQRESNSNLFYKGICKRKPFHKGKYEIKTFLTKNTEDPLQRKYKGKSCCCVILRGGGKVLL